MLRNFRRNFGRVVKRLKGEPLTLADLTKITCAME